MLKEVNGDVFDSDADYIAHGVNCQGVMGAGVARIIRDAWPEVFADYETLCHRFAHQPEILLGGVLPSTITGSPLIILNAFTQLAPMTSRRAVNYNSVALCFEKINKLCAGKTVAMPRIGAGLAGGDWDIIRVIVEKSAPDVDITVYNI
jgi:O-acetyl-ADP-ribose deacetylase (regulator of RNase III)